MELNFNRREKAVGVFIVCIAVLMLATVVMIGRGKDWFKTYATYYTSFKESYNLTSNTAVKLLNAEIGKVKQITLVENRVRVKLYILEEYASRIRTDSVVSVQSPTFIGSEFVNIKPGSQTAALIPEGGEIPSIEKKSITDFLNEFEVEKTAKMIVEAIQNLSKIVTTLQDPQGPLFALLNNTNHSLANLDRIIKDLQAGKGTLGGLLKSSELLDEIQDKIEKLGPILGNIDSAVAKAPATIEKLGPILSHIDRAVAKAPAAIEKLGPILSHINRAVAKAPATVDQIQDSLATFKQLGDEITEKIAGVNDLLAVTEEAVTSLKTILKDIEKGSPEIPQILRSAKMNLVDVREAIGNLDKLIQALQNNILIRSNLPPEPVLEDIDAGLRN